jgi:hypothetical protein
MKTQQDIVERLKTDSGKILDFSPEVVIPYLTFEQAKPFLNAEALKEEPEIEKEWVAAPLDEGQIIAEMKEYMQEFGWDKAQNHRSISASRSKDKMEAWCWLLDKEKEIDWDNYTNYGAPILKQVCELFKFAIPTYEGVLNMAAGKKCAPDCEMGCGT